MNNAVHQIATHGKAREQEVQRLGRIGRKKLSDRAQEAGSIFYSLLSTHTNDVETAAHRAQYVEELMGLERKEIEFDKLPLSMVAGRDAAGSASGRQDQTLCKCLAAALAATDKHLTFFKSVALVGQPPVHYEDPHWPWVIQVQGAPNNGKKSAKPSQKPSNALFKKRARDSASQWHEHHPGGGGGGGGGAAGAGAGMGAGQ